MIVPTSPISEPVAENAARRRLLGLRGSILLVIAGIVLVAVSAGFFRWSLDSADGARDRYSNAVEAAKKSEVERLATIARLAAARVVADRLAAEVKAKADSDATAIAAGFTPGGTNVYWKPAPSSCGYLNCSTVLVTVIQDCFRGVYVAASLMSGSTSIGLTNGITAGLPAGGSAVLRMEFSSRPDSVTVTDAHCLG